MQPPINHMIKDMRFATLFKVVFAAGLCTWSLFAVFCMVVAIVSPDSVTINDQKATTAAEALLIVPIILVLGGVLSLFGALIGATVLRFAAPYLPLGRAEFVTQTNMFGVREG
ncbi:MAG: hypothetical protein GYB42_06305 [Alphaproteobacteria bacterium]|nr:hypothetical protein [Alphaproteobacteria bacterium]